MTHKDFRNWQSPSVLPPKLSYRCQDFIHCAWSITECKLHWKEVWFGVRQFFFFWVSDIFHKLPLEGVHQHSQQLGSKSFIMKRFWQNIVVFTTDHTLSCLDCRSCSSSIPVGKLRKEKIIVINYSPYLCCLSQGHNWSSSPFSNHTL
jgi:hypothetical protein